MEEIKILAINPNTKEECKHNDEPQHYYVVWGSKFIINCKRNNNEAIRVRDILREIYKQGQEDMAADFRDLLGAASKEED